MTEQFCLNCGTEVDDDARFCPVCGQAMEPPEPPVAAAPVAANVEGAAPQPDAPAVPESAAPVDVEAAVEAEAVVEPEPEAEPEPGPAQGPVLAPEPAPAVAPPPEVARGADLPFTWPTMLSGWLIGAGSLLAAIGMAPSLGRAVSVIVFVALLWVAGSVFLADRLPDLPHERLVILAVALIGLGMALDRTGFDLRGWDTTFLIGMLAAAGGALLIELDRDRPMPPPDRPSS